MTTRAKRSEGARTDGEAPASEPTTFLESYGNDVVEDLLADDDEGQTVVRRRRGKSRARVAKADEDTHNHSVSTRDELLKIKVPIDSPKEGAREHGPRDAEVDLGRAFFSDGPEMAEARLVRLVAEMAAKHPEREEALKAKLAEVIGPTKEKKLKKTDATLRTAKEVETPPRTGHPLIEKFAALWDRREMLPRTKLVKQFQSLLDEFSNIKTMKSYDDNNHGCRWANLISKKSHIKMRLCSGEAVTLWCANRREFGYFVPRRSASPTRPVPNRSSAEFPKLTAVPL